MRYTKGALFLKKRCILEKKIFQANFPKLSIKVSSRSQTLFTPGPNPFHFPISRVSSYEKRLLRIFVGPPIQTGGLQTGDHTYPAAGVIWNHIKRGVFPNQSPTLINHKMSKLLPNYFMILPSSLIFIFWAFLSLILWSNHQKIPRCPDSPFKASKFM